MTTTTTKAAMRPMTRVRVVKVKEDVEEEVTEEDIEVEAKEVVVSGFQTPCRKQPFQSSCCCIYKNIRKQTQIRWSDS